MATTATLPARTVLSDRFEVVECLGQQAGFSLYRGRRLDNQTPVALKVLDASVSGNHAALDAIARGADKIRDKKYPGLFVIHAFLQQEGQYVLVEEWIHGAPLLKLLRSQALGPLPVIRLLTPLAKGLDHALASGLKARSFGISDIVIEAPLNLGADWLTRPVDQWEGAELKIDPLPVSPNALAGTSGKQANASVESFIHLLYQMLGGKPLLESETFVYTPVVRLSEAGNRVMQELFSGRNRRKSCPRALLDLGMAEAIGRDVLKPLEESDSLETAGFAARPRVAEPRLPSSPATSATEAVIEAKMAEIAQLKQSLEARKKEEELEALRADLDRQLSALEAERDRFRRQMESERQRLADENAAREAEIERARAEVEASREAVREQEAQVQAQREGVANESAKLRKLQDRLNLQGVELEEREGALQENQRLLDEAQGAFESRRQGLESEATALNEELRLNEQKLEELRQLESRTSAQEGLISDLEASRLEIHVQQQRLNERERELEMQSKAQAKRLEELIAKHEAALADQRRKMEKERAAFARQQASLNAREDELKQTEQSQIIARDELLRRTRQLPPEDANVLARSETAANKATEVSSPGTDSREPAGPWSAPVPVRSDCQDQPASPWGDESRDSAAVGVPSRWRKFRRIVATAAVLVALAIGGGWWYIDVYPRHVAGEKEKEVERLRNERQKTVLAGMTLEDVSAGLNTARHYLREHPDDFEAPSGFTQSFEAKLALLVEAQFGVRLFQEGGVDAVRQFLSRAGFSAPRPCLEELDRLLSTNFAIEWKPAIDSWDLLTRLASGESFPGPLERIQAHFKLRTLLGGERIPGYLEEAFRMAVEKAHALVTGETFERNVYARLGAGAVSSRDSGDLTLHVLTDEEIVALGELDQPPKAKAVAAYLKLAHHAVFEPGTEVAERRFLEVIADCLAVLEQMSIDGGEEVDRRCRLMNFASRVLRASYGALAFGDEPPPHLVLGSQADEIPAIKTIARLRETSSAKPEIDLLSQASAHQPLILNLIRSDAGWLRLEEFFSILAEVGASADLRSELLKVELPAALIREMRDLLVILHSFHETYFQAKLNSINKKRFTDYAKNSNESITRTIPAELKDIVEKIRKLEATTHAVERAKASGRREAEVEAYFQMAKILAVAAEGFALHWSAYRLQPRSTRPELTRPEQIEENRSAEQRFVENLKQESVFSHEGLHGLLALRQYYQGVGTDWQSDTRADLFAMVTWSCAFLDLEMPGIAAPAVMEREVDSLTIQFRLHVTARLLAVEALAQLRALSEQDKETLKESLRRVLKEYSPPADEEPDGDT